MRIGPIRIGISIFGPQMSELFGKDLVGGHVLIDVGFGGFKSA